MMIFEEHASVRLKQDILVDDPAVATAVFDRSVVPLNIIPAGTEGVIVMTAPGIPEYVVEFF